MQDFSLRWRDPNSITPVQLDDSTVDVYCALYDDISHIEVDGLLSTKEKVQASKKLIPYQRHIWSLAHGLLRLLLSRYVQESPRQLDFYKSQNGKPLLKRYPQIHFSLSHTEHFFAIAVSRSPVGIDIEEIGIMPFHEIAEVYFTPAENNLLLQASDKVITFYQTWVAKEAAIKCLDISLEALNSRRSTVHTKIMAPHPNVCGAIARRIC